eukprot:CAMPEP_0179409872 /NCGR_PEP_ID=MMETSP0799-20121207/2958_1 /TAXON_ID=46947 /ORGANISM="Geminigera cryophila, Strain CCMP2564" /LENGTH=441 /DNA_ID=CAMNT_0021181629 /DNA_START=73 /DNA_END=1396 /DNA_ORIENTATION=-
MAKPNFSGVYSLKSSENEDAFLQAQGVGWVLRKAAKAVGSKRVVVEHVDDILKIKAGLVDLEYEIGGEAIPTRFMGFEFTDGCDWHSDGVSLCQTKCYKDGSKVETVRTLSADRQLLTYANCWVDAHGANEVKSSQILQRIADVPSHASSSRSTTAGAPRSTGTSASASDICYGIEALCISAAPPRLGGLRSALNTMLEFVTGYDTPPGGYCTPPEEFRELISHEELLRQLSRTKDATNPITLQTKIPFTQASRGDFHTSVEGGGDTMGEAATVVKLKWMWADAGVSSKLAQVNPFRWSGAMTPAELKSSLVKQDKERPVLITLLGQKQKIRFPNPVSAAAWIDESTAHLSTTASTPAATTSPAAPMAAAPAVVAPEHKLEGVLGVWRFVAPAYCVYFIRRYAKTSWRQKNVFVASAYARRLSQLPHQVSSMQEYEDDWVA